MAAKKIDLIINKIKTIYITWADKKFKQKGKLVVTAKKYTNSKTLKINLYLGTVIRRKPEKKKSERNWF